MVAMRRFIVEEREVFSTLRSRKNASNENVICSRDIFQYENAYVAMYQNVYNFPVYVSAGFCSELMEMNFYGIEKNTREPIKIPKSYWDEIIRYKIALTVRVWSINEKKEGVIVIFPRSECVTIGDIAHESDHVADMICDKTGVKYGDFDNGEAHAYLTGWVGDCVANTLGMFEKSKKCQKNITTGQSM